MSTKLGVDAAIRQLIGLKLTVARNAADLKNFQLGEIRAPSNGKGTVGEFALHIQCAWRIAGPNGIITGSADRYEPVQPNGSVDEADWVAGNLQSQRLAKLFGGQDPQTRSIVNVTELLRVTEVRCGLFGAFDLTLSGGHSLEVLPDSARDEAWRLFAPDGDSDHYVFGAGGGS